MHYVNKGQPPKGGSYLVCDNAKRNNGCQYASWRYGEFETDLIRFISSDIDVSKLLPDHDRTEREIDGLKREWASIRGQLSKAGNEIENLTSSITTTPDKRVRGLLESKLTGILDTKERLEKADKEAEGKINALERSSNNLQERIENMRELTAYLKKAKPGEVIDIRLKLREALRGAIDEITVFANGFRDRKHVDELTPKEKRRVFSKGIVNKDWRFYKVQLKGCRSFTRGFYPVGVSDKLKEIEREIDRKRKGFFKIRDGR